MRGLSVPVLELATIAINIGLCVAIMRSAGNRAANPFFLAIGLFAVLMIGRHLMLVSGADVEFPEYLFIQDNSPWRLLAGLGISLWLAGVLVASTFSYRRAPKPYLPSFPHEPASFSALRGVAYVLLLATMALLGTLVMATGEGLVNTSYLLRPTLRPPDQHQVRGHPHRVLPDGPGGQPTPAADDIGAVAGTRLDAGSAAAGSIDAAVR
jgi:hypothetical protein